MQGVRWVYTREGAFYILGAAGLGMGAEANGRGGPGSCLLPVVSQGPPEAPEAEVRRGGWKGRALVKGLRSRGRESPGGPGRLGDGV